MKTKALSSFFVLFALVAGMATMAPAAFADHSEVTITTGTVSLNAPGCEETDECYIPGNATVDVGGKVIMTNSDTTGIHTFTSGTVEGYAPTPDGKFDSSFLNADQSFEWIADTEGEYPYYCSLHTWMQGTIIVQEAEAQENNMGGSMGGDDPALEREENPSATGMLSDGTMVSIWTSEPTAGEAMEIFIEFYGENAEHVNHDIMVTQNDEEVLMDIDAHHHDGTGTHTTAPLGSFDPVDVMVTFQGYGIDDPKTGPIGEQVVFTNVVPEFGTIAMMILAVAIISIVAVTAKSRVVPRF